MTIKELEFLELFVKKCKAAKKVMDGAESPESYSLACQEFDNMDVISSLMEKIDQRFTSLPERIQKVKEVVIKETVGVVNLTDEIVSKIIEQCL